MRILSELLTVFQFCCCAGWILEVLYRSICSKRFVNPGFLVGPWLPIYGFGGIIVYLLCKLPISNLATVGDTVVFFLVSCLIMTLLEGIAGLILLYGFHTRLWNYDELPLNIKGIVCMQFSLIWGIMCILFRLLIYPLLCDLASGWCLTNPAVFFSGTWTGIFAVDLWYSLELSQKIRHYAKMQKTVIHIEKLKAEIYDRAKKLHTLPKMPFFRGHGMLRKHIDKIISDFNDKRGK